jgi:MoaA/NifB/PqqE/SkfB family radical SAM enzyme
LATLIQKIGLLRGLLTREQAFAGPFLATVDVTGRCNLSCLCCPFHSPQPAPRRGVSESGLDIDYDLACGFLTEARAMGLHFVMFSGEGEPFLYPRLLDLIDVAKGLGLETMALTNGTLLTDRTIETLIDLRLDRLQVSMWATSEDEYRLTYPGVDPANFERTLAAVRRVAARKRERGSALPELTMHRPLDRYNLGGVTAYATLAAELGCDRVSFSPLSFTGGPAGEHALSADEEAVARQSLLDLRARLKGTGLRHNIDLTLWRYSIGRSPWEHLPCTFGWVHARLKPDGRIVPCNHCDVVLGSLREHRLRDVWNSAATRRFRRQAMTRPGLAALQDRCDCGYCCHLADNQRVHRWFKWFARA